MSAARKPKPRELVTAQRLLYDVPSAAFQLGGLSTREVKRRLAMKPEDGGLRPTRIGKRVFVSHTTLLEYIERHTQETKS